MFFCFLFLQTSLVVTSSFRVKGFLVIILLVISNICLDKTNVSRFVQMYLHLDEFLYICS